jgi:hypothetical protein
MKGAMLFGKYNKNKTLQRNFLFIDKPNMLEKMKYELTKIYKSLCPEGEINEKKATSKAKTPSKPEVKAVQATKEEAKEAYEGKSKEELIASLTAQKTAVFNKKGKLSNKLADASDAEAKSLIKEIDAYEEELVQINKNLAYVEEKGCLPSSEEQKKSSGELPEDKAELMKMLTNARSRKAKASKKMKQFGKGPAGVKAKEAFDKEDKLIKSIEEKLK